MTLSPEEIYPLAATIHIVADVPYVPWTLRVVTNTRELFRKDNLTSHHLDTILVDCCHRPNELLTFKAYYVFAGNVLDSSTTLAFHTSDTSRHSFSWSQYQLGDFSSYATDAAYVSDSCAWAVGLFLVADKPNPSDWSVYGAAKWDGAAWRYMPILASSYGTTELHSAEATSIYAFSENDIYISTLAGLHRKSRDTFVQVAMFMDQPPPFVNQIKCIWGRDTTNIYCGGRTGAIYKVHGATWNRLETGTDLDIVDIYGAINPINGQEEIVAVAWSSDKATPPVLLSIAGSTVTQISSEGVSGYLSGIWFDPGRKYITVGRNAYSKDESLSQSVWRGDDVSGASISPKYSIRGNSRDDFVVSTWGSEIVHFNGVDYKTWTFPSVTRFQRTSFSGNRVAVAGEGAGIGRGFICLGKR